MLNASSSSAQFFYLDYLASSYTHEEQRSIDCSLFAACRMTCPHASEVWSIIHSTGKSYQADPAPWWVSLFESPTLIGWHPCALITFADHYLMSFDPLNVIPPTYKLWRTVDWLSLLKASIAPRQLTCRPISSASRANSATRYTSRSWWIKNPLTPSLCPIYDRSLRSSFARTVQSVAKPARCFTPRITSTSPRATPSS